MPSQRLREFINRFFVGEPRVPAQIAGRPVRVVVAGHDLKFMEPYLKLFREDEAFELRIDEHDGHNIKSEAFSHECVEWADVVFCEWALGNLVWYSSNKKQDQLLLSRLHLQEWHDRDRIKYVYQVKWERVDKLLLTSHHVYDEIIQEFPALRGPRARVLYCPIDASGDLNRAKLEGANRRLGIVGIIPRRKRVDLAFEILQKVQQVEPDFQLYVKSRRPEEYDWMVKYRPDEMAWYNEVLSQAESVLRPGSVIWDAHGSDMPEWYRKIGFLISTSDFEGSHQAVAESMAAGCVPIIRDWQGANRLYPPANVWNSTDEAAAMILASKEEALFAHSSALARLYSVSQFDQPSMQHYLRGLISTYFADNKVTELGPPSRVRAATTRVLILGYISPGYQSGYRVRIEEEIRNLLRWGVEVHFACLHAPASRSDLEAHERAFAELGATVHLIASPAFFNPALAPQAIAAELEALSEICRAHAIGVVHAEALYSMRVAMLLQEIVPNLQLVFDVHGATPEEEIMGGAAKERIAAAVEWESRAINVSTRNVFVSEAMRAHFRVKYGHDRHQDVVVPCCVAESRFPDRKLVQPLFPSDGPVVAYAGTLSTWQCGDEMFRLFSALHRHDPTIHFLLLISANDTNKAEELVVKHGLPREQTLLKSLSYSEVPAVLARADLGVLLRRQDPVNAVASPTKFAEYLAAGLPVLVTDGVGDFSGLTEETQLGLVLQAEFLGSGQYSTALLEEICTFATLCQRERDPFRERCQQLARERFHWDQGGRTLADLFQEIMARAQAAGEP